MAAHGASVMGVAMANTFLNSGYDDAPTSSGEAPTQGKSVEENAKALSDKSGKNSVPYETPSKEGAY